MNSSSLRVISSAVPGFGASGLLSLMGCLMVSDSSRRGKRHLGAARSRAESLQRHENKAIPVA
jgi:hypothetical protein